MISNECDKVRWLSCQFITNLYFSGMLTTKINRNIYNHLVTLLPVKLTFLECE